VARKFVKAILLLVGAEALAACSSTHPPSENGGLIREHNEAYSLLYKMMSDESKVDQIFALKHADDSVANVVKDIAAFCSVAKQKMDAFPKSDPHIEYDVADLPKLGHRYESAAFFQWREIRGSPSVHSGPGDAIRQEFSLDARRRGRQPGAQELSERHVASLQRSLRSSDEAFDREIPMI
jgi:hypothetical protein